MRVTRPIISFLVISFCLVPLLIAQSTSTGSSTQAATIIQNAISALTGKTAVSDITLTGSVAWIAGSDQENGSATYQAVATANNLNMNFAGGTRSEIRTLSTTNPSGTWTGLDGVSHTMALQNLLIDPGWFPLFALQNTTSASNTVLTYVGPETQNNVSVTHITASQQSTGSTTTESTLMQGLTQVDIYVSSLTYLPVSYAYSIHPDNNAALNIPCQILYSNYQNIGGAQIPLHVQKFVNNTLALDLQFQTATPNTGLTVAQITAQ